MVRAVQLLGCISAAAALAAPRPQRPATKLAAAVADPALASREAFDQVVQKTYGRYPVTIVKGNGCELEDDAGRTYLDFVAGISTCCLGHGDQRMVDAITDQIKKVHHVSNLYCAGRRLSVIQLRGDGVGSDATRLVAHRPIPSQISPTRASSRPGS